ncbi:MAG: hypothetical protein M0Z99_27610 [Betaproteobacteria bacterium]|nr:hypothetical protein [Betaproteobacteria bacterium]
MSDDYSKWAFAGDDQAAEERFQKFHVLDPLPEIPPALLNEMDIYDYCRITGMVLPFEQDQKILKEKLKFASYEIDFLGDVHYIDDVDGSHKVETIERSTPFVLRKNSIAFVYLKTEFRLPYYIAIRFNLKITHVHRGLLLGTGPLIDPGYKGRLLIPLHNLTSLNYTLIGGDGLIWVEFTKLSPHPLWNMEAQRSEERGPTEALPHRKIGFSAQKFFNRASDGRPAASSIPGEVRVAKVSADEAKSTVEEIRKKIRDYAILGGVALGVGLASVLIAALNLISTANTSVSNATNAVTSTRDEQMKLQKRIGDLEAEIKSLRPPTPQKKKQFSLAPQKADMVDLQLKVFSHPVSNNTSTKIPKENN